MQRKLAQFEAIVQSDPAVEGVAGTIGSTSTGQVFVDLRPRDQRDASADEVIARLRGKLAQVAGARLFLQSVQEFRLGGRASNAQYQYTLNGEDLNDLYDFAPRFVAALRRSPTLADVSADLRRNGSQTNLVMDRERAARLGLSARQVDDMLYDAFGQRHVSVIYGPTDQYRVVMEVAPRYGQDPEILKDLFVGVSSGAAPGRASAGAITRSGSEIASADAARIERGAAGAAVGASRRTMASLASIARFGSSNAPTVVNHHGLFAAVTVSFNLQPGATLGGAVDELRRTAAALHMPVSIHGSLEGAARAFEDSLANQGWLIAGAILAVYVMVGVLYESLIHPVTILSTLPSAGVGAVGALMLFGVDFSIIALIGVLLLIGIVKKNAILMIDFALEAQRSEGLAPREAIYRASMMRFRPIMMTTIAAILGALPLALSFGDGGELRRPLGISIVGGLSISQLLTLYTTPVIYVYLDRLRGWSERRWRGLVRSA
jgi:multidrug efflux pump